MIVIFPAFSKKKKKRKADIQKQTLQEYNNSMIITSIDDGARMEIALERYVCIARVQQDC